MIRDGRWLREKIELTIDDRQVAALAVGALLLLSGMFALGLLVGMQVARRSAQPAISGDLVALDAQRALAQRAPVREPAAPGPQAAAHKPAAEAPPAAAPVRSEAARKDLPPPPAAVNVAPARAVAVDPGSPAALPEAPLDPGKFIWYRVRVGAFADKESAERFRRDVERELRTSAVVMPAR